MVLLGGDLFHDNKPSRTAMHRVMEILSKYVPGEREIDIAVVSDQRVNFGGSGSHRTCVNYEDPNFNIQLPVFIIHGNHDDPVGEGGLASIDILSSANLVNYFGKVDQVDNIKIAPVCIQKGNTKLALYGLGHVRDQRLHRTFESNNVTLLRPAEHTDAWFNIAVVHQNRHRHAHKDYLEESFLHEMLDLCVWGHEHECLIAEGMSGLPETERDVIIIQPGSTVATSLIGGESKPKHVGLLEVKEQKWKMTPIPLKTIRPMMIDTVKLADIHADIESTDPEEVATALEDMVNRMIDAAHAQLEERNVNMSLPEYSKLTLPLIRLNVECGKLSNPFHPQRFGQRFVGKVSNPTDMIVFKKGRQAEGPRPVAAVEEEEAIVSHTTPMELNSADITTYVGEILAMHTKKLLVLSAEGLTEAVKQFAEKDEKHAIEDFVKQRLKRAQLLLSTDGDDDRFESKSEHDADAPDNQVDKDQLINLRSTISNVLNNDAELLNSNIVIPDLDDGVPADDNNNDAPPPPPATKKRTARSKPIVVADDDDASPPAKRRKTPASVASSTSSRKTPSRVAPIPTATTNTPLLTPLSQNSRTTTPTKATPRPRASPAAKTKPLESVQNILIFLIFEFRTGSCLVRGDPKITLLGFLCLLVFLFLFICFLLFFSSSFGCLFVLDSLRLLGSFVTRQTRQDIFFENFK
eukprot:c18682_g1_i1.p1 GENE.c18682_g1_i1~~c18682_g1_i1.p1  ORF type:complete len:749 (+),score=185.56 c18682_g1_i1:172-2247(+)